MATRYTPHVVVRNISRFQSSRNGTKPQLIVIHATESENRPGSDDEASIGSWFNNPSAQVSAHVCTDADGFSGRYVTDDRKAWHCARYNSVSLGIEQIGHTAQASWTRDEIRETARWVARWNLAYGIPIRKGQVSGGSVVRSGVVTHHDLGALGGNHGDPGGAYPMQGLLSLAKFYRSHL